MRAKGVETAGAMHLFSPVSAVSEGSLALEAGFLVKPQSFHFLLLDSSQPT